MPLYFREKISTYFCYALILQPTYVPIFDNSDDAYHMREIKSEIR